jgi:hypothetical protein
VSDRPRIAYLVTSHRLPEQVLRLVTLLRRGSPQATILVHHNDVECTVDRAALAAVGADVVEPPTPVQWGEFSQVAMLLRCIRRLLAGSPFEWLVLLSGQDYPIRPLDEVERELGTRGFDAYIEMFRCERPASYADYDEFASRYHYRWHVVPNALRGPALWLAPHVQPFVRARTLPAGLRIGVPARRSPFGAGLVCHYGPDWFTLSRRAAEAVERFADDRPDVVRHFRQTLCPSESFVHTILAGEPGLTLATIASSCTSRPPTPDRGCCAVTIWTPSSAPRRASRASSTGPSTRRYSTSSTAVCTRPTRPNHRVSRRGRGSAERASARRPAS